MRALQLFLRFREVLFRAFGELWMYSWLSIKPGYMQICPLIRGQIVSLSQLFVPGLISIRSSLFDDPF